jgi:hypothetical protein
MARIMRFADQASRSEPAVAPPCTATDAAATLATSTSRERWPATALDLASATRERSLAHPAIQVRTNLSQVRSEKRTISSGSAHRRRFLSDGRDARTRRSDPRSVRNADCTVS